MKDDLSGGRTMIRIDMYAVGTDGIPHRGRYLAHRAHSRRERRFVNIKNILRESLRYHESVAGRNRFRVEKGESIFIFIDNLRGNLSADYLHENSVFLHGGSIQ